jgi:hypothetical protein
MIASSEPGPAGTSPSASSGGRLRRWQRRYEVDRPGRLIEVFFGEPVSRHCDIDEFGARLQTAGFDGIAMRRGYTEAQSSDPGDDLVLSARRPSGR